MATNIQTRENALNSKLDLRMAWLKTHSLFDPEWDTVVKELNEINASLYGIKSRKNVSSKHGQTGIESASIWICKDFY